MSAEVFESVNYWVLNVLRAALLLIKIPAGATARF